MAINAIRHFLLNEPLGLPTVADLDGDTGLVRGGNGEAEDLAPHEVGQGVDGGFGVEKARDGPWLSADLLPSSEASRGFPRTSCPVPSDSEDGGEDWSVK